MVLWCFTNCAAAAWQYRVLLRQRWTKNASESLDSKNVKKWWNGITKMRKKKKKTIKSVKERDWKQHKKVSKHKKKQLNIICFDINPWMILWYFTKCDTSTGPDRVLLRQRWTKKLPNLWIQKMSKNEGTESQKNEKMCKRIRLKGTQKVSKSK